MPKLTEFKGSEVLPGKKKHIESCAYIYLNSITNEVHEFSCDCGARQANLMIDAYNNVRIEGDVEALADVLMSPSKSKQLNINFGVINRHKAEFLARRIISSMPTWVVVKK